MKKILLKMTMIAIVAFISCGLSSCNRLYYQVYNVHSNGLIQKDNALMYENGDIKVVYNLWDEEGNVGFIFQNKTNMDLFIDMDQTFFIRNGIAKDYFKDREYTTSRTTTFSEGYAVSQNYVRVYGYWPSRYYVPTTVSGLNKLVRGTSKAITMKERKFVCIPAHSCKVIYEYKISPELNVTCDHKQDYPHHIANIGTYSESSTPLKFRNRIAYSCTNDGKGLQYIENDFYISGITNYSKKAAIEKVKDKTDCYSSEREKRKCFKIGGPDKFYKIYIKKRW
ncbi:MAG: hypothetical protein LKE47_09420 [Prevotella sp.]|jgi:hypothetical protein|nr:hypothetical protein [Prevotella sp.]MCH3970587.1 hypothetical protein [Prevotella sp.]MCH4018046.1 hypothetical protein [Prevotella sp.]MCH4100760.1 hypothetical protein [Prevotella sp.]MCI1323988.1 hypothetical protein [Prevotella sp.]MCI1348640.1 hypothetical protein [Prevotella sp.]